MLGPTTNYGSVCDATGTFSDREAVVACRTMGYIGGRVLPKSDFLGCCPGFVAISNLRCKGSEVSLSGCSYNLSPNCTHDQDVGVACDGARLQNQQTKRNRPPVGLPLPLNAHACCHLRFAVPPHVQVRLANGKAFNNGRLEVSSAGAWIGTCLLPCWLALGAHPSHRPTTKHISSPTRVAPACRSASAASGAPCVVLASTRRPPRWCAATST